MKLSSEAKAGVIGIVSLAVLIWGINYLKGRNILSSTYSLIALYYESGGLETSAPVVMNGVKIGYVDEIILRPDEVPPVKVVLNIEKSFPVDKFATADLFSADLLGTKAIRILKTAETRRLKDNDTITTSVTPDMLNSIRDQITPVVVQVNSLAGSLDTLAKKIHSLMNSENTRIILQDISSVSESLKQSLISGGSLNQTFQNLNNFTSTLSHQQDEIASMISHLNSIAENVDSSGIKEITAKFDKLASQFSILLDQINSGSGSAGRLIYSDSLVTNLEILIFDLDKLVRDLNENPQDYVHFSLFGKSKKSE